MWIKPESDDIQMIKDCQVLPCDVHGYWDFSNTQYSAFIVDNRDYYKRGPETKGCWNFYLEPFFDL